MKKTPTPRFLGVVENGELILEKPEQFKLYLHRLKGNVALTIVRSRTKPDRERSENQNRYYWGVVVALVAEHCGYEDEDCHDALKHLFLTDRTTGKLPKTRSTTDLTTIEMEEYMARIRTWASTELAVFIPLPNETEFDYQ